MVDQSYGDETKEPDMESGLAGDKEKPAYGTNPDIDTRSDQTIPISSVAVGNRYRKDLGDLTDLMESIRRVGLLHPIVIGPDRSLIAGQRRLEACRSLDWDTVPVRIIDLKDTAMAEHDENVVRKPFLPSEAVAIKRAIEPELKEQAKQRQRKAGRIGGTISGKGRKKEQGGEKFSHAYSKKTRDTVSAVTGLSHPSMRKAEAIVSAAENDPEKYDHLVQEMDTTGRVDPVYRELVNLQKPQQEKAKESRVSDLETDSQADEPPLKDDILIVGQPPGRETEPSPLETSRLPSLEFAKAEKVPPIWDIDVILVNAPWERLGKGRYPYLAGDAIVSGVPLGVLASTDCIVWLRATNSQMDDAYRVLQCWGITPKTILTWVKPDSVENEWLNDRTEHYIMAVVGNPPIRRDGKPNTVLVAPPKNGYHKPDGFYQLIELMCLGQSRLEIFCEGPQEGWKSWTPSGLVERFHSRYATDTTDENGHGPQKEHKKKRE
jgi:ParB family chromosome partitioning protein